MKIPLVYPKIHDTTNCPLRKCVAFEKYDGTNLHWVWNQEKGWTGFGTRRDRFELNPDGIVEFHQAHPGLEDCVDIFNQSIKVLDRYLLSAKYKPSKEIIVFTEYFGAKSFAGQHEKDDPKKLVAIDCLTDFGWLNPSQFGGDFSFHLPKENFPNIIYGGNYSGRLVEDIRNGKYSVNEGAIIRSNDFDPKLVDYRAKVKTNAYMEKLKNNFKDKWKDYWE